MLDRLESRLPSRKFHRTIHSTQLLPFSFFPFASPLPLLLLQPAQDQAAGGAQSATDKARNLASSALDTAQSYLGEGQKNASQAADAATNKAGELSQQAQQAGKDASRTADDLASQAKGAVQDATKK